MWQDQGEAKESRISIQWTDFETARITIWLRECMLQRCREVEAYVSGQVRKIPNLRSA